MTTDTNPERARFEAYYKSAGGNIERASPEDGTDSYKWLDTHEAWKLWCAALASPAVPPQEPVAYAHKNDGCEPISAGVWAALVPELQAEYSIPLYTFPAVPPANAGDGDSVGALRAGALPRLVEGSPIAADEASTTSSEEAEFPGAPLGRQTPNFIGLARAALDMSDYKAMFTAAVQSLANVDEALGLPEDGCSDPERTLDAIEELKAAAGRGEALARAVLADQVAKD